MHLSFVIHEPSPVWLVVQLLSGTIVTLAAINISIVGRYFYLLNALLLINIIWNGINIVSMQGLSQWQAILFSAYLLILVGMGFVFVFRNSYYSTSRIDGKHQKQGLVKFSYIMNLLYGVIVIILSLFFLWSFLFFDGIGIDAFITLIPILIWLIFYKFQMNFIAKSRLYLWRQVYWFL